jgi:hypothetical protein
MSRYSMVLCEQCQVWSHTLEWDSKNVGAWDGELFRVCSVETAKCLECGNVLIGDIIILPGGSKFSPVPKEQANG